jgi:hypothetical protein
MTKSCAREGRCSSPPLLLLIVTTGLCPLYTDYSADASVGSLQAVSQNSAFIATNPGNTHLLQVNNFRIETDAQSRRRKGEHGATVPRSPIWRESRRGIAKTMAVHDATITRLAG